MIYKGMPLLAKLFLLFFSWSLFIDIPIVKIVIDTYEGLNVYINQ